MSPRTRVEKLHVELKVPNLVTIMRPEESEPPILSGATRGAVHQWLIEMGAKSELEMLKVAPRKAALFSGPPGCGKTTLAHHIAARYGVPLVLVDMHRLATRAVHGTGQNIGDLFEAAAADGDRMMLLLDEFDALASKRTEDQQAAAKEQNAITVAFLQCLDRHKGTVIAATNRGDGIDPAVWRRFALQVKIELPDEDARFAIIVRYLDPLTLTDESVDLLVEATRGASPALLRSLMEQVKRDTVLAPKLKLDTGAVATFARTLVAVEPHADAQRPPLWSDEDVLDSLAALDWPPTRKQPEGKAA